MFVVVDFYKRQPLFGIINERELLSYDVAYKTQCFIHVFSDTQPF